MSLQLIKNSLNTLCKEKHVYTQTFDNGTVVRRGCISSLWALGCGWLGYRQDVRIVRKIFSYSVQNAPIEQPKLSLPSKRECLQLAEEEIVHLLTKTSAVIAKKDVDAVVQKCERTFLWKNTLSDLQNRIERAQTLEELDHLATEIEGLPDRRTTFYSGLFGHVVYGVKEKLEESYVRILQKQINDAFTLNPFDESRANNPFAEDLLVTAEKILEKMETRPTWHARFHLSPSIRTEHNTQLRALMEIRLQQKIEAFVENQPQTVGLLLQETRTQGPLFFLHAALVQQQQRQLQSFQGELQALASVAAFFQRAHFSLSPVLVSKLEQARITYSQIDKAYHTLTQLHRDLASPELSVEDYFQRLQNCIKLRDVFPKTFAFYVDELQSRFGIFFQSKIEAFQGALRNLPADFSIADGIKKLTEYKVLVSQIEKGKKDLESFRLRCSIPKEIAWYQEQRARLENAILSFTGTGGALFLCFQKQQQGILKRLDDVRNQKAESSLEKELELLEPKALQRQTLFRDVCTLQADFDAVSTSLPAEDKMNPFGFFSGLKESQNVLRQQAILLEKTHSHAREYQQKILAFQKLISEPRLAQLLRSSTYHDFYVQEIKQMRRVMEKIEREERALRVLPWFHYKEVISMKKYVEEADTKLLAGQQIDPLLWALFMQIFPFAWKASQHATSKKSQKQPLTLEQKRTRQDQKREAQRMYQKPISLRKK